MLCGLIWRPNSLCLSTGGHFRVAVTLLAELLLHKEEGLVGLARQAQSINLKQLHLVVNLSDSFGMGICMGILTCKRYVCIKIRNS